VKDLNNKKLRAAGIYNSIGDALRELEVGKIYDIAAVDPPGNSYRDGTWLYTGDNKFRNISSTAEIDVSEFPRNTTLNVKHNYQQELASSRTISISMAQKEFSNSRVRNTTSAVISDTKSVPTTVKKVIERIDRSNRRSNDFTIKELTKVSERITSIDFETSFGKAAEKALWEDAYTGAVTISDFSYYKYGTHIVSDTRNVSRSKQYFDRKIAAKWFHGVNPDIHGKVGKNNVTQLLQVLYKKTYEMLYKRDSDHASSIINKHEVPTTAMRDIRGIIRTLRKSEIAGNVDGESFDVIHNTVAKFNTKYGSDAWFEEVSDKVLSLKDEKVGHIKIDGTGWSKRRLVTDVYLSDNVVDDIVSESNNHTDVWAYGSMERKVVENRQRELQKEIAALSVDIRNNSNTEQKQHRLTDLKRKESHAKQFVSNNKDAMAFFSTVIADIGGFRDNDFFHTVNSTKKFLLDLGIDEKLVANSVQELGLDINQKNMKGSSIESIMSTLFYDYKTETHTPSADAFDLNVLLKTLSNMEKKRSSTDLKYSPNRGTVSFTIDETNRFVRKLVTRTVSNHSLSNLTNEQLINAHNKMMEYAAEKTIALNKVKGFKSTDDITKLVVNEQYSAYKENLGLGAAHIVEKVNGPNSKYLSQTDKLSHTYAPSMLSRIASKRGMFGATTNIMLGLAAWQMINREDEKTPTVNTGSHSSIDTVARRIATSDFGSPWLGGGLSSGLNMFVRNMMVRFGSEFRGSVNSKTVQTMANVFSAKDGLSELVEVSRRGLLPAVLSAKKNVVKKITTADYDSYITNLRGKIDKDFIVRKIEDNQGNLSKSISSKENTYKRIKRGLYKGRGEVLKSKIEKKHIEEKIPTDYSINTAERKPHLLYVKNDIRGTAKAFSEYNYFPELSKKTGQHLEEQALIKSHKYMDIKHPMQEYSNPTISKYNGWFKLNEPVIKKRINIQDGLIPKEIEHASKPMQLLSKPVEEYKPLIVSDTSTKMLRHNEIKTPYAYLSNNKERPALDFGNGKITDKKYVSSVKMETILRDVSPEIQTPPQVFHKSKNIEQGSIVPINLNRTNYVEHANKMLQAGVNKNNYPEASWF